MMNDAADLVKAGVEAAMKPVSEVIEKIAGPAAEELGLTIQDTVKVFRLKRQIRLWNKVKQICQEANIEPSRMPLKLVAPIIENASLEEEDDLQDVWANMLANAANPREENPVAPSFPAILKELSARDVKFLNSMYEMALKGTGARPRAGFGNVETFQFDQLDLLLVLTAAKLARYPRLLPYEEADKKEHKAERAADKREVEFIVDLLKRQGVVAQKFEMPVQEGNTNTYKLGIKHSLSHLGRCFVEACRPPDAPRMKS
jgi:hypothetical protein